MNDNIRMADRFRGFLPIVVDVETGGFNSKTDALLEIAAVLLDINSEGLLERMPDREPVHRGRSRKSCLSIPELRAGRVHELRKERAFVGVVTNHEGDSGLGSVGEGGHRRRGENRAVNDRVEVSAGVEVGSVGVGEHCWLDFPQAIDLTGARSDN